ncbi:MULTISPECIES: DUF6979 family protein [Enterobacter]|uniref:DUF6979 family protein n=1 Tax=Enterobacter TaxID=547 RepID=UPI0015EA0436|nr:MULTISPECIES: hypothetical protein [Enterobacter]HDR2788423.1 hypothetical protein [Enterobacter asburiae]QMR78848.1 hypothetical protein HV107_25960 [Enterobacter sp. RHBSTW-00175]WNT34898.1 hypothetical protein RRL13_13970 [Enterobacter cloacae]HDR2793311.1 hypothetical protein [Enterobacter asburiae]HDR2798618.1 hypothetical protein [Enterobacter asburiae]
MKASQSSYGVITLNAVELIRQRFTPVEAWSQAVAGKEKACPKSAFLGLCQFGWVKDVPAGEYLSTRALAGPNKDYTIRAAQLLLAEPDADYTPQALWTLSIADCSQLPANHNQQMNVVLALKEAGLLIEGTVP